MLISLPNSDTSTQMRTTMQHTAFSAASLLKVQSTERHALVIGNSKYAQGALLNPVNDANDMAAQLKTLGYKVYGGGPALDLDRINMEQTLRAFSRQLPENATALLYFAGHGMATERDNYLIPVRHSLTYEEQLPDRAVSLRATVELLKNANRDGINVVLLDACRDNPLGRSFRSNRTGLNRLNDIPKGVFIGYAADFGQVAGDGILRNGTYTRELLSVMREKPGVIIEVAHKEAAARVYNKTGGKQFPVSENKVYGDWCFGECTKPVAEISLPQKNEAPQPAPQTSNRWLVVGGVVLAAIAVGLASGGSSGSGSSNTNFTLQLPPP